MKHALAGRKFAWFAGMLFVVVCMPVSLFAQQTLLNRLAAEFRNFNGTESVTSLGVPGTVIYSKSVFVPNSPTVNNTLYVTLSTTGWTDRNASSWFSCSVDGVLCNPGAGGGSGAPAGWVSLQKESSVLKDNSIYYTWCMKTQPGAHTVELRMASSNPSSQVAIETAHFYIDSNNISLGTATGCSQGAP